MWAVVLAPGAGGSAESLRPFAAVLERALPPGSTVARVGQGRSEFAAAVATAACSGRRVLAAGFSYGSRVALRVAADSAPAVSACACFGFPLFAASSAPANSDRGRELEAFAAARACPCVFVSGSADEYVAGEHRARLAALAARMPPPSRAHVIEGAGHGLRAAGKRSRASEALAEEAACAVAAFLREVGAAPAGAPPPAPPAPRPSSSAQPAAARGAKRPRAGGGAAPPRARLRGI
jgi:predicted alpha/beta-hydrolase family hydrolase